MDYRKRVVTLIEGQSIEKMIGSGLLDDKKCRNLIIVEAVHSAIENGNPICAVIEKMAGIFGISIRQVRYIYESNRKLIRLLR